MVDVQFLVVEHASASLPVSAERTLLTLTDELRLRQRLASKPFS